MKRTFVTATMLISITACNGGGGGGSGSGGSASTVITSGSSITGQFIDSPVKGLVVKKASGDSTTGDNGAFSCKAGEEIIFKIHDKEIGSANCNEKIYIYDLVGSNDQDGAAALLQSLARNTGSSLDLTDFNSSPVSLLAVDISSTSNADSGIDTLFSSNPDLVSAGLSKVTTNAAASHVAANLPDLSSDALLASIAGEGQQTLSLDLVSGGENCWSSIDVKFSLSSVGSTYRFNVHQYLAYESESAPTSPVCDGEERGGEADAYQCIPNPVNSKIITGRSVNGMYYQRRTFAASAGGYLGCLFGEDLEVGVNGGDSAWCGSESGVTVQAASNLNLSWDEGYDFAITVSESGYTLSFTEYATDFAQIGQGSGSNPVVVDIVTAPFVCKYSKSESFE